MYCSLEAKDNVTELVVVLCCFSNNADEFAQSFCSVSPLIPPACTPLITQTACFLNTWPRLRMQFSSHEIFSLCKAFSLVQIWTSAYLTWYSNYLVYSSKQIPNVSDYICNHTHRILLALFIFNSKYGQLECVIYSEKNCTHTLIKIFVFFCEFLSMESLTML